MGAVRKVRRFPNGQERRGGANRAPWVKAIGKSSWDDILDGSSYLIDLTGIADNEQEVARFAKAVRRAAHTRGHGLRAHVDGFKVTVQAVLDERVAS